MTSLRFLLRAVGICARVAVSARGMVAMPAIPKRSRRLLVRAVTICTSVAAVAYLVVAPPAAPAQAAPASPAAAAAQLAQAGPASRAAMAARLARALKALPLAGNQPLAGTHLSVTNPGGDLVISMEDPGVDPTLANQVLTTYWPQAVGVPAGASLSDLMQATWGLAKSDSTPPRPAAHLQRRFDIGVRNHRHDRHPRS